MKNQKKTRKLKNNTIKSKLKCCCCCCRFSFSVSHSFSVYFLYSAEGVCHRIQYCKAFFGWIHTGKNSHFQARFEEMVAKDVRACRCIANTKIFWWHSNWWRWWSKVFAQGNKNKNKEIQWKMKSRIVFFSSSKY